MAEVKYPSNSYSDRKRNQNAKEPDQKNKRKVDAVVKSTVTRKKKSEASKIKDMFFSQDVGSIKNYILMDVIIPALKKAISDTVKDGIDMALYGQRQPRRRDGVAGSFRDYAGISRTVTAPLRRSSSSSVYNYDGLAFETRQDAEDVLDALAIMLDDYDDVTVADMFQLAGMTPAFTDYNYGWNNIASATVERLRDGTYTICMPRPKHIS